MKGEYEMVLWGVLEGNEDWQEELLSTNPDRFEEIKAMAARDGFGRFRIARVDLNRPPDFAATVKGASR